jgi:hypothetical protein
MVPAEEATELAAEAIEPATEAAAEAAEAAVLAEEVAVSTRLVTVALRRYQTTSRRIARLGLARRCLSSESESFGGNGFHDALEQVTRTPCGEDQLGVGWIIFQFGTQP